MPSTWKCAIPAIGGLLSTTTVSETKMRNSRMKVRGVVLTGMILSIAAQSQIIKEQASMEAKIESKRYCEVDSKSASLAIKFSVALKNSTGTTITMRQPIHVVPFVSRTLQDLQHSKYELILYSPDDFG